MSVDRTRLRVRGAPLPRPVDEHHDPTQSARSVVIVHVQANDREQPERAVAVELLDGAPLDIVGSDLSGDLLEARAWAARQLVPSFPGTRITPTVLDLAQLVRFFVRRCADRSAVFAAFDVPWTVGRLSANARRPKAGTGLSLGLVGCGWSHRETGKWMDSDYYSRLRVDPREGEDGGAFARWIPSRSRRKSKRPAAGPIIDLKVFGAALGHDVESPAALATGLGVPWPSFPASLDRLLVEGLALAECYRRLVTELGEIAPGLAPQSCWSAGSAITHGLQEAGMRSPAETTASLPAAAIGGAAASFHGASTSALLVGHLTTMALADLNATYPAMFSLLGLTPHLSADHFESVPVDPAEVTELLCASGLRGRLDDRSFWRSLGSLFVVVEPHGQSALPCQRQADDRWRSVVVPLDLSGGALPFQACDLIRSALDGGLDKIVRAFRVEAAGVAEGLEPVRLPSGASVDLTREDYGQALITERELASAGAAMCGHNRVTFAKGLAVSGAWGIFARVDRRQSRTPVDAWAVGPFGDVLSAMTNRPDLAGPRTLWHLAAAMPAACRAIVGIACQDIEHDLGGSIAAIAVDSIAVPAALDGRLEACAGGPQRLRDGTEAIRLASSEALGSVLSRFDRLLYPDGGAAWKIEHDTLARPTAGLVVGVNKLLLGRACEGGWTLVRSSDTGLGDHFLDPTGTGARLDDGRTTWSAELEERLLADVAGRGNGASMRVPPDLPPWASLPALRPGRASSLDDLRRLRRQLGDETVMPFARYVTVDTGSAAAPICLGSGRDPAAWRSWRFARAGAPCQVAVPDEHGDLLVSDGAGPIVVGRRVKDVLRPWLAEHDPTTGGPARGLRHVLPVQSHPALVEVVGRSGEAAGEVAADDPLVFSAGDRGSLLAEAGALASGAELARRTGLRPRTAQRVVAGDVVPSEETIGRLAATEPVEDRPCTGCGTPLSGRTNRRWCTEQCRARSARERRAGESSTPDTTDLAVLLGRHFAIDTVPMSRHPSFLRAAAEVLRHMDVASAVERVLGYGSLNGATDAARVLTARLGWVSDDVRIRAELAAKDGAEEQARRAIAETQHRELLSGLVEQGELTEQEAVEELARRGYGVPSPVDERSLR